MASSFGSKFLIIQYFSRTDLPGRVSAMLAAMECDGGFADTRQDAAMRELYEAARRTGDILTRSYLDAVWEAANDKSISQSAAREAIDACRDRILDLMTTQDRHLLENRLVAAWGHIGNVFGHPADVFSMVMLHTIGYAVLERGASRSVASVRHTRAGADTALGSAANRWDFFLACPAQGAVPLTPFAEFVKTLEGWI